MDVFLTETTVNGLTDINILVITLVMFVIGLAVAYLYNNKMVLMLSSILWLVPVFIVQDTIIVLFSVIMFILQITFTIKDDEGTDF